MAKISDADQAAGDDFSTSRRLGEVTRRFVDFFMSKIRGIMGVEFADFGGIRRLAKINLVDPTHVPAMLGDVQDRVLATLVRRLRHAITGDPDK